MADTTIFEAVGEMAGRLARLQGEVAGDGGVPSVATLTMMMNLATDLQRLAITIALDHKRLDFIEGLP